MRSAISIAVLVMSSTSHAATLPAEFEGQARALAPLFAYFGGVAGITITPSSRLVHSGRSEEVGILWQPDPSFTSAGAVVGDRLISGADLAIPPDAAWLSVSIDAPGEGVVSLEVVLREDDNADGLIDPLNDDDEWRTARIFLAPGRAAYNFALAALFDANAEGDGVQGFATTGAMAVELIIETRAAYPGGMLTSPATYTVDHLGLFSAVQALPARPDLNADGSVNGADLGLLLGAWGPCDTACESDLNGNGFVDGADLGLLLGAWGDLP